MSEDAHPQRFRFRPEMSLIESRTDDCAPLSLLTVTGTAVNDYAGVNVGIPVPREPFAFGGLSGSLSKYGDFDVTAEGAMEFFTNRRKVRG